MFLFRLFLIFFSFTFTSAQQDYKLRNDVFENKLKDYRKLMLSDPDKGILLNGKLLVEAKKIKNVDAELLLYSHQCWYNMYKVNTQQLLKSAHDLEIRSESLGKKRFQAIANTYILYAYSHNQLENEATNAFNKVIYLLKDENSHDIKIIETKNNAYTYLTNLYLHTNRSKKAIEILKEAKFNLNLVEDKSKKNDFLYRNYSHLGAAYLHDNLDSSYYYVSQSIALKSSNFPENDDVSILNYSLLGDIETKRHNYSSAIQHYKLVEKLIPTNYDLMNLAELYRGFVISYKGLNEQDSVLIYQTRLKDLELKIVQDKNKSLHKILEKTRVVKQTNESYKVVLIVVCFLLFSILLIIVFFFFRDKSKVNSLLNQESANIDLENQYVFLIEKFKEDSKEFNDDFNKSFPNFSDRLKSINQTIVESEIEFCRYLKLNFSTKDIAKYKNLSPKTVQNKKYRIRKKLNIPDSEDIYFFFNKI